MKALKRTALLANDSSKVQLVGCLVVGLLEQGTSAFKVWAQITLYEEIIN